MCPSVNKPAVRNFVEYDTNIPGYVLQIAAGGPG